MCGVKMKIAVCLSGQLRNFHDCYEYFFKFLSNYECDYFINTWDEYGGKKDDLQDDYDVKKINVKEKFTKLIEELLKKEDKK